MKAAKQIPQAPRSNVIGLPKPTTYTLVIRENKLCFHHWDPEEDMPGRRAFYKGWELCLFIRSAVTESLFPEGFKRYDYLDAGALCQQMCEGPDKEKIIEKGSRISEELGITLEIN